MIWGMDLRDQNITVQNESFWFNPRQNEWRVTK